MGVDVLSRQVERIGGCTDSDSSDEDDKDQKQARSSNAAVSLGLNPGDTGASRPGTISSARVYPSVTATALNNGSSRNPSSLRQRSSSISSKFPIRHTIAQKLRARVEQTDTNGEALQPAKDDDDEDDEDESDVPDTLPTHAATSNHWRRTAYPEGGHYKGTFYVPSKKPWYILLPHNRFRTAWDIFMTCLLLILAFYIPFRVCFYFDEDADTDRQALFWIELAADCLFAFDIVLNFLTAYG